MYVHLGMNAGPMRLVLLTATSSHVDCRHAWLLYLHYINCKSI